MTLKLFYTPVFGFIHKSVVAACEAGVWGQIEQVPVYIRQNGYSIAAINPLAKVPTLARDDGVVLYGSQTICEYLDSLRTSGTPLYPTNNDARWDALRRLALGDILFDITVRIGQERLNTPPMAYVLQWQWPKVGRALDQMERDARKGFKSFDIGQVGWLQGISYLQRHTDQGLPAPLPQTYDWRNKRPALTAWFNEVIQRPSVTSHFNKEFDGEDSAVFCQSKVAEVLKSQGLNLDSEMHFSENVDFISPSGGDDPKYQS